MKTEECPRGLDCESLSNIISDDKTTFVCVGLHGIDKHDKYRHCFKSKTTDTMYDYDEYDILSTISVMSKSLVIDHLTNKS